MTVNRAERLTNLVAALDVSRPKSVREIVREVEGYPESFDSARVQFERDKKDLRGENVEIERIGDGDGDEARYRIDPAT